MPSLPTCSLSRTTPCNLSFRVFYCPDFPLDLIRHDQSPKGCRADYRLALAEDIRRRGLYNPLIVLNHPRAKCPDLWLMVGQNRYWALRHLGWVTAPVVITGSSPVPARELETWDDLRQCFRDGEPYRSPYGIALRGTAAPEKYEYPV
jgi:hypothetical protein